MLVPPTGLARQTDPVDEPMPQSPSAAATVEVSSTEVLITTQQVLFSTAAAVAVRRDNVSGWLVSIVRRMFVTSTDVSRPRRQHHPKRYGFIEDAAMARAMERL
jgi:hypothetical protein